MEQKRIYQIFVGRWQIANVRDHAGSVFKRLLKVDFSQLNDFGFDHVYLTGLFDSRGPIVVREEEEVDISDKDHRVPSVFAITDHQHFYPNLGTTEDFLDLVKKLHESGQKVLVDYVPNHTSLEHHWLKLYPDYYQKNKDGEARTAFSGDVAELDYSNFRVREEMMSVLEWIVALPVEPFQPPTRK